MSVWKSDETLLSICILNFSFKNDFVWEEISNIRHSVSSPDETPRSSSKILRCASYFQLSSRCFIWWWNTASHVWYITSQCLDIWWNNPSGVSHITSDITDGTIFLVLETLLTEIYFTEKPPQFFYKGPVDRKVDNVIHRINLIPVWWAQ